MENNPEITQWDLNKNGGIHMEIFDLIIKETNGINQHSDQYQIRSNSSNAVHMEQEHPFTPDKCPSLSAPDNFMLDELFSYADMLLTDKSALHEFCRLAYERFSPREIFGYLYWHREMQDDETKFMIIHILNDLMLEDDE